MINLAFIDDNADILSMMSMYCERIAELSCVYTADDAQQACDHLLSAPPAIDLVCCDVTMPGITGFEIIHRVNEAHKHLSPDFAIITAHTNLNQANSPHPIVEFLYKPIFFKDFRAFVTRYIAHLSEQHAIHVTDEYLRDHINRLIYIRKTQGALQFTFEDQRFLGHADLASLTQKFPNLIQIHRDYYLNRQYLASVNENQKTIITTRNHYLPFESHYFS